MCLCSNGCEKNQSFGADTASAASKVYTITRNTVIDYFRAHRTCAELPEDLPDEVGVDDGLLRQESLRTLGEALGKLDDRGRMFVKAGDPVYEGMIIGIHSRDNDLVVNATRTKQLTNFRVSGKEDAIKITPPIELSLEYGVEFIEDDELLEITPTSLRVRKRFLKEHERKRASRD